MDRSYSWGNLKLSGWAYLALHGIGVDLTHVGAPVLGLGVLDVERPRTEVVVRDGEPGIVRDDVLVDRQYRLGVRLDPGHLLIPTAHGKQIEKKSHRPKFHTISHLL